MSALDNLIAQNSAPQQGPSSLDALIAQNAAASAPVPASAAGGSGTAAVPAAAGQPPGYLASFGAGLGHGVQQAVLGGQQLAGRGLTALGSDHVGPWLTQDAEQGIARGNAEYAPYSAANPITAGAGNIGGNIAATAPLAMLAPESLGATMLGRIGTGAALGAANGAVTPVDPSQGDFASAKLGQMSTGAAFGGGGAGLTSVLGGLISGAGGEAQRRLAQMGVTMTPGQIFGGAGAKYEDMLTSWPIIGDFVKNAQQRSVQSFNRATFQSALDPIGQQLPRDVAAGSEGVSYVRNQIGNIYDSIVPRASLTADQNLSGDIATIRTGLSQNSPASLQQFDNIVQHQIAGKLQGGIIPQGGNLPIGGIMNGQQWNDTRSAIAGIARNRLAGNSTPDDRVLADALDDLGDAVNNAVGRSSPPDVLPTLSRANAAYAQYKQVERAAGMAGASNNGNIFTASQYANAARNGATTFQKATNSGLNGQMASDATEVLGSKYPDSGTPGRAALMAIPGAFMGSELLPHSVTIPAAVGGLAASLPYTAMGQRLGQTLLMARPQAAQAIGQGIGQRVSPFAALLGASLANGSAP